MAGNDRVMREILDETITSGEQGRLLESGRTMCAAKSEVDAPVARFPRAVDLSRCPVGLSGVWHTHATENQIEHPTNSLPDIANVIFADVDVHFAVGTRTAEAVIAPRDPDAAQEAYRNAVGVDVRSVEGIVEALDTGRISDYTAAHERIRNALGPLTVRYQTSYDDLERRANNYFGVTGERPPTETVRAAAPEQTTAPDAGRIRQRSRNAGKIFDEIEGRLNLKSEAASTTIGIVVGSAVSRVLGLE